MARCAELRSLRVALRTSAVVAGVLLSGASSGHAQLVGQCFDSTLGEWTPIPDTHFGPGEPAPPPRSELEARFHGFPPRLLFSGRPFERDSAWNRVEIPVGALPVPKPFRIWRVEADTLEISLSDGFTGVRARLTDAGGAWRGALELRTDAGGTQRYERTIALTRNDCASEPPVPASADDPLPREVPAAGGPALRLGEPLPAAYSYEPDSRMRDGGWLIGFEPSGFWSGADRILVSFGADARLAKVEIRYSRGFDTSRLAEGLVDGYGPGIPDAPWPSWWNSDTRVFLQRSGTPRVVLIDTTLTR